MTIRVDAAVDAIKAASDHEDQLVIEYEDSADGLGLDIISWPLLCPVLEILSTQNWFPESDWLEAIIEEHRQDSKLKLSHDRFGQLQDTINEVDARLPVILEAWDSMVHPRGREAFHVSLQPSDFPEFSQLAEQLSEAFKLLAVDYSFSVVVSEGFIVVVPEGPYSHFCATFALYLAKKSQELLLGEDARKLRGVIKHLPGYDGKPINESSIEEAMLKWVSDELQQDWDWFEQVRNEHFPQSNGARNNIEKAVPLLIDLLKDGRCEIDPPKEIPSADGSDGLATMFQRLQSGITRVSTSLNSADKLQRTALNAIDSLKDFL